MNKWILPAVAAVALGGSAFALSAVAAPDPSDAPGPHWMADQGFLLDARLAGMKAALKLNSDQEKLWPAFEAAVRDGVKARRENMRAMRQEMHGDEPPSPVAMMTDMSDHLAKMSESLKKVADAAKPLYDSLNDEQKDHFGALLHMLRAGGPHHGGWGGHGHGMMMGPDMRDGEPM